jgi:hypothetical protein
MVQVVPFVGLLIGRLTPGRIGVVSVLAFSILWAILTILEDRTALGGKRSVIALATS